MSLALLEYELRIRRRVVVGWGLLVALWLAFTIWYWSTLEEPAVEELQRLIEQSPEWVIRFFAKGSPVAFTYQVYYVLEYHVMVYVLLLGALAAYLGAGAVVDDVLGRTGGLAMLATPTGRTGVLLVRLAALMAVALANTNIPDNIDGTTTSAGERRGAVVASQTPPSRTNIPGNLYNPRAPSRVDTTNKHS